MKTLEVCSQGRGDPEKKQRRGSFHKHSGRFPPGGGGCRLEAGLKYLQYSETRLCHAKTTAVLPKGKLKAEVRMAIVFKIGSLID